MTKFPGLVDFIEEYGMKELRSLYNDCCKDLDESLTKHPSFGEFVEDYYQESLKEWNDEMDYKRELDVYFNEENDVVCESAKLVVVELINQGIKEGKIKKIILQQEVSPDWNSAMSLNDYIWSWVIPAIEKTLKRLND